MTTEQIINYIGELGGYASTQGWDDEYREATIEAIKRVLILDKIRIEIEALNPVDYVSMSSYEGHRGASDMKDDVLQIIDKYKAESEGK